MNVLFLDSVHPILSEMLAAKGFNCIHAEEFSGVEIEKLLPSTDGLVIRSRFPVNQTFLEKCPKLKFIARSGAGMENIDIPFCDEINIRLFNSPEGNCNAVGEHALALLLSLMNHIHLGNAEVKNRIWDREKNRGVELDGKTVGIIGLGNNGSAFAKKLRGFEVTILAYDKYKTNFSTDQIKESTIEEIQNQADIISFHVPQNKETISYFNQRFLEQMKKPFFLLNVSRGKVVESQIVVEGIKNGKIIGAGLDVLDYENGSFENFIETEFSEDFNYLLSSKKTLLSPHVAGWTTESYFKLSSVLGDKILSEFST
jgi:D-3-phosphoglycerate dehydrogenase